MKKSIATMKLTTEVQNVNLKPLALVSLLLKINIIGMGAKADEFITVICQLLFNPIEFEAILVWLNKNKSKPKKNKENNKIHQM
jgi:hypothetical protein